MNHLLNTFKHKLSHTNLLSCLPCMAVVIILLTLLVANYVKAEESFTLQDDSSLERVYLYTSFYTRHFSPQPDHVNDQDMLGVEFQMTDNWVHGFAMFDNSYGQETQYLYTGYKWTFADMDEIETSHHYFKLTGGLMDGYKDEYQDKIPFNGMGVAPAIVPTYGYQYKNYMAEISLGGISVATVTVGFHF